MPLLNGNWSLNVNGNEGTLNIMNIGVDGAISGIIMIPGSGQTGIQFMGYWNEAAQSIFFETMTMIVQPGGSHNSANDNRAQFFGSLFSSQNPGVPGTDIRWILCGQMSSSMANPFPGVQVNSRRTMFGWYADIKQVI